MHALARSLREELRCPEPEAERLAAVARAARHTFGGTPEDADEDLLVRLRDPVAFGAFATPLMDDPDWTAGTRRALAEHVFDLLPLPPREDEAFAVSGRAPGNLLAFAELLVKQGAFTPIHLLHLVYSAFLDRSLVIAVPPRVRARALVRAAGAAQGAENALLLYAVLHLAAVPSVEGAATLRHLLSFRGVPEGLKRSLSALAASPNGGAEAWTRLAQSEALLAGDVESDSPAGIANAPRLPEPVQAVARGWLAWHAEPLVPSARIRGEP